MIHILDRQTERILDVLVNQSDSKIYWDTKMTEGLEDNVLIFEFRMLADSPAAKHIVPKNKLTAQDQDGFHRLFIIDSVETSHDANGKILFVSALGDHIELANDEPIPPQTLPGQTAETAVQFVLANTRYVPGQIDFAGSRTITFDTYTNPLAALQKIASVFDLELRFRVNVNPDGSITRIVDMLKPDDLFDGKEIVFGKDMTGIRRKENTENICTRLVGIGPADEDGNLVTFASVNGGKIYVEDEEAFQRWNNAGRHIWGIFEYQPEDDTEVTPQQLLDATKKEMEKRKNSAVEWEVQAAALEQVIGLEHERVRVGMNVRIKDEAFDPPIYLEARVLETEMPELDDPNGNFSYTFGNYREVKVVVPAEVKAIQKILFHNSGGWSAAKVKADIAQQIANEAKADVEAANARIDNLIAVDITALHAEIENLEAVKANVEDLFSINAQIENLRAEKANITDLEATNARIDDLVANDLTAINAAITNLQAEKADITDLNAVNATIETLQADVGSINTLLAGNLGAENFRAGAIYAGSGVIAQGAIGDAEISNLNASKINAGILNTALVTIQGANGRLKMSGNRLQVFANKTDGTLYERVSLGDVNGDGSVYGLRVRGADGQTILLDENGVKREGITDGSITNEKIADDANISGTKLDIASVVTEINEGTTTIQSSKIFYNGKTLDIQLGTMQTTINNQGQTITNHETRITATEQGLATKVSVSQYQQDQAALSSQLSQMSTQIQQQANQIALKADAANVYTKSQIDGQFTTVNTQISNLSAQLTVQADQIATKVSRTEFDALQIGGRNLLRNTDFRNGLNNWSNWGTATREVVDLNGKKWVHLSQNDSNRWRGVSQVVLSIKPSTPYTVSFIAYSQNNSVMTVGFHQRLGYTIVDQNWQTFTLTNSPKKYSYTFTTTGSSIDQFNFMIGNDQSPFDIYITDIKLEIGNRATDWTPAPEDVQGQIDGLGTRVSSAETSITQLSDQIALKANQSTVDTLTGQVSSIQSQLTVQAEQIATKVEKNGVISAINQTAESIKIQASKVDLSGYVTFTNLSTPGQTTIDGGNIKANSITVDKLTIGDFTNLCENPDFEGDTVGSTPKGFNSVSYARVADISGFTNGNGSNRALEIDARNGLNSDVYASNIFPVRPGQQFFIEAEARYLNTAGTGHLRIGFRRYDEKKTPLSAWHHVVRWDDAKVTSFTRKSGTFTVPSGTGYLQIWISFYNNGETTNKAYIDNIRVHRMAAGELIVDGSITTEKLAAKSITAEKLNVTSLDAISADLGTVTAGTIKGVNIEGAQITQTGNTGSILLTNEGLIVRDTSAKRRIGIFTSNTNFQGFSASAITFEPNTDEQFYVGTGLHGLGDGFIGFSKDVSYSRSLIIRNNAFTSNPTDSKIGLWSPKVEVFGLLNVVANSKQLVLEEYDNNGKQWHIEVNNGALNLVETNIATRLTLYPGGGLETRDDIIFSVGLGRVVADSSATYIQNNTEIRATKYKSTTLVPVRASSFPTGSLAEYKEDIHPWQESALEKIRQATIYEYYLKSELEQGVYRKRQGLVVGEGYNTPDGVIDGDGVEQYLMNAWSWKAIQELDVDLSATIDRIAWLETENSYLKQRVNYLENKLNELEAQIA